MATVGRVGESMPTCRHCGFTGGRENFIHGIGPRKDVCSRCGVNKGIVSTEEVPNYYSKEVASARWNLVARRWAPWFWVSILWSLWIVVLSSIQTWDWVSLCILIVISLLLPVRHILTSAAFNANLERITPDYERPKGH